MMSFKVSIAVTSCVLTLLPGMAFATDLHPLVPNPNTNPGAATAAPGQTGSNVLSSCGQTLPAFPSLGAGAKTTTGMGSPFNPNATKTYAGNAGNPATNPKAVSQYDNACAQAVLH
jgi:hypothetical protein